MRLLLDTSAWSALGRGHAVVADQVRKAEQIVVTPIVLAEAIAGFRKGRHYQQNMTDLEHFMSSPRVRISNVTRDTAECYAVIFDGLRRTGRPIPTNDLWIAASAMEHGLAVLTTDVHFERVAQIRSIVATV